MAWNLAYDHIRKWVMESPQRLSDLNGGLQKRFPKNQITIKTIPDFDEFKESQILDGLATGRLIDKNTEALLREKLRKRNSAAHPSLIKITQAQADDVIIDLINNVLLHFA